MEVPVNPLDNSPLSAEEETRRDVFSVQCSVFSVQCEGVSEGVRSNSVKDFMDVSDYFARLK